jgi:hypothetical protein
VGALLAPAGEGVAEAAERDDRGPPRVAGVNVEAVLAQQGEPVAEGDPGKEAGAAEEEQPLAPGHEVDCR